MDGLSVGLQCFRSGAEAAAAACSSVAGVSSAGVSSCEAPSLSAGVVSYTLVTEGSTGRTTRSATMELQPCDPVDMVSFSPVLFAWLLACVAVVAGKQVYTKVFNRETA